MPTRVTIENLVILDELESRMRRSAARLAALAAEAPAARLREAARALSRFVPELVPVAEELADEAVRETTDPSAAPDSATGGEEEDLSGVDSKTLVLKARSLVTKLKEAGDEEALERAKELWHLVSSERLGPAGAPAGEGGAIDPAAAAEWIALSRDLWAAAPHVRYLDAVERAYYNGILLAQTDDGAGVVGRTLDGERGEVDDAAATPAVAIALAATGSHVLMTDTDGALVSGISANSSASLSVDGECRLRVLVQTQIPVRGWTSWVFEPLKEITDSASAVTRRTARGRGAARGGAPESGEDGQDPGAATFTFRVRVPKWAAFSGRKPDEDRGSGGGAGSGRRGAGGSTAMSGRRGPGVKIDGRPANVRREGGFYRFEVPTDRQSKIEVILEIGPWMLDRKSPVSWGNEVAVGYGPLLLTALSRLNPGEDLSMPLRIVSEAAEIELVGDIRRRLPLVQAKAVGGGGRTGGALFAPVSEVGGLAGAPGTRRPIHCQEFRTWHRRGR